MNAMTNETHGADEGYEVVDDAGTRDSRAYGWSVGFGLQQVDNLTPSEYAYDVAYRHINGDISYAQAAHELREYHAEHPEEREHREADLVSQRISQLLQEPVFAFSPDVLKLIHGRLFNGIYPKWAGQWRTENIRKTEPVLNGESVPYSEHTWIVPTLQYDFDQEKQRQGSYLRADKQEVADSIFSFISGIWQIHPFREGNTRATAIFGILYLRSFGFQIDSEPFERASQYFRDALVLANAPDIEQRTDTPLKTFTQALLFDDSIELPSLRNEKR